MEKIAYDIGFALALAHAGFSKEALFKDAGVLKRVVKFLKQKPTTAMDTAAYRKATGQIVKSQGGGAKAGAGAVDSAANKMVARMKRNRPPRPPRRPVGRAYDPKKHVTQPA